MQQYRALVAELEALLPAQLSRKQQQHQQDDGDGGGATAALAVLPVVLNNLHDFFNHVAARLEKLHDGVAAARDAFLERRRQVGGLYNRPAGCDRCASPSVGAELRHGSSRFVATVDGCVQDTRSS